MVVELIREPDFQAFIAGHPRPQGSKTSFGNGRMRESSKYVKQWRATMTAIAKGIFHNHPPLEGPLTLQATFVMPRAKALSARKPTPPHIYKPDLDKLFRAVGDALKDAGVYGDDSQIVSARVDKRVAHYGEQPGVSVQIWAGGIPYV